MKPLSELTCRKGIGIKQGQRFLSFPHISLALVTCTMLLLGCAKQPAHTGAGVKSEVTVAPTRTVSPTPTPAPPNITLKVINCPAGLSSLNWDGLVGTRPHVNKVQQVMCGSLEGPGSLEALINVRYYSADAKLDYYVFDNVSGRPSRTFSMPGLLNGDALISPVGTIMTAEIGPGDTLKGKPDVFKEYRWQTGTFAQVLFPGMYPDMTHYQAEQDQAQLGAELAAGNKRDAWKSTFLGPAAHLATTIFHWTNIHTSTVRFSNHDGLYIVAVTNLGQGGGGFIATMFHLDYNISNVYEITQVTSIAGDVTVKAPVTAAQVTSPISVSGSTLANGSILGKVVVYSDIYIAVGDSGDIHGPAPSGYVNFTKTVTYQLNSSGVQEGAVAFYETNQNNSNASNQVIMIKVFLKDPINR
jgi:hypothetical protein